MPPTLKGLIIIITIVTDNNVIIVTNNIIIVTNNIIVITNNIVTIQNKLIELMESKLNFFSSIVTIDWRYQIWKAGVTITDNVSLKFSCHVYCELLE